MAHWTIQRVSVPNLKLLGSTKTELWAKKVGDFSILSYGEMGWWARFYLPTWLPQYQYRDFLNFEQL